MELHCTFILSQNTDVRRHTRTWQNSAERNGRMVFTRCNQSQILFVRPKFHSKTPFCSCMHVIVLSMAIVQCEVLSFILCATKRSFSLHFNVLTLFERQPACIPIFAPKTKSHHSVDSTEARPFVQGQCFLAVWLMLSHFFIWFGLKQEQLLFR